MNNPRFYIFGVPDGFDMLSGTPEEILYYQLFYNTSKKGTELRINRKANGETVYSYLKYNFVSCKGRTGSFFGMSVVFPDSCYCNNPMALKELLDGVYSQVILGAKDNDKIIAPMEGDNAAGRFCITGFENCKEMCDKIGRIVINNLITDNRFVESMTKIDGTFNNSNEGRMVTLPFEADNLEINEALKSYNWVSVSTEYKPKPQIQPSVGDTTGSQKNKSSHSYEDLLTEEYIKKITNQADSYKDFIIKILTLTNPSVEDKVSVLNKEQEIVQILDCLDKYEHFQPELKSLRENYSTIYGNICSLKAKIKDERKQESNGGFWEFMNGYKMIIAVGFSVLLAVVLYLAVSLDNSMDNSDHAANGEVANNPEITSENHDSFDNERFDNLLKKNEFLEAFEMLEEEKRADLKESRYSTLYNKYKNWLSKEFNDIKVEKNKDRLIDLESQLENSFFKLYNEDNKEDLNFDRKKIAELKNKLTLPAKKSDRNEDDKKPSIEEVQELQIFKADDSYTPIGEPINNKVIECQRKDHFLIKGVDIIGSYKDKVIGITREPNNRVAKLQIKQFGCHKLKLNGVDYTFNALN